jgi:acyl carrier protein phosphodiesterase
MADFVNFAANIANWVRLAPFPSIIWIALNFLAHLFLSGTNREVIFGNLIGDFVKGNSFRNLYPKDVVDGICLHRSIDFFTDTHPVNEAVRKRMHGHFGKYSGIVLDVFYDHLLAGSWSLWHDDGLDEFIASRLQQMSDFDFLYPNGFEPLLKSMKRHNWLANYKTPEGMHVTFQRMSNRLQRPEISDAWDIMSLHHEHYLEAFQQFFPELINHASHFLQDEKN